jgi:hypothetical protein
MRANVLEALEYEIARADLEYADNYRAYRVHDGLGKAEYHGALAKGCCGFFDASAVVDGEKWRIGCNFGH